MPIITDFQAEVDFEQTSYSPDIPINIGSRVTITQCLKKDTGEFLTLQETQRFMEENIPKTSICVLLDNSGSMDGSPLENAKKVIKYFVQHVLSSNDYFSLITFNSRCNLVINQMKIKGNLEHILTEVSMITASSTTNIPDAIKMGLDVMKRTTLGYTKNIILFTDGMNTVGPRNCKEIIQKLNDEIPDWSKSSINCCSLGGDVDLETLNTISKESESKIIVIEESSDIIPNFVDMFMNLIHQNNQELLIRFEHTENLPKKLMMTDLREIYSTDKVQKYRLPKTVIGEKNKFNICFPEVNCSYFDHLKIEIEIHDTKTKTVVSNPIIFYPIFSIEDNYDFNYEISLDFLEIEYQKLMKQFNSSYDKSILKSFYNKCKNSEIPVDNPRMKELLSNLEEFNKPMDNYRRARISMYSSPYVLPTRSAAAPIVDDDDEDDSPLRTMSSQLYSQIC